MGVHVEKAPLSDSMHDELMVGSRDSDGVMTYSMKKTNAFWAWEEQSRLSMVDISPAQYAPNSRASMGLSMSLKRQDGVLPSRKRRQYREARPTKIRKLSTLPLRILVTTEGGESACEQARHTSPTSLQLQFALPGLSSADTWRLFGELQSAWHELSWLNGTMPVDTKIHPVFGWRSAIWTVPTPAGDKSVVIKSVKAFESVGMLGIARRMWNWHGSNDFPELEAVEPVYTITRHVRIVRQRDSLYGRAKHAPLWLECTRVQGESIVILRKELHRFRDTVVGQKSPRERECHGYILHPLLIPMRSQVVSGTALHTVCSLRSRDQSSARQISNMVEDMPRHVLQWEDCFVRM